MSWPEGGDLRTDKLQTAEVMVVAVVHQHRYKNLRIVGICS